MVGVNLIATDAGWRDARIITNGTFDVSSGDEENLMTLKMDIADERLEKGALVYVDGTDAGGIIDALEVNTDKGDATVTYSGRSWSGILSNRIVLAPQGKDAYTATGEANAAIQALVEHLELDDVFAASGADSGVEIGSYAFAELCNAWDGLRGMLASSGAKLSMAYDGALRRVVLSAVPIRDYSADAEFDSDIQAGFSMTSRRLVANHAIGAGAGEGKDREIVHRYADAEGRVSSKRTFSGVDMIDILYEDTNAETDDLVDKTVENLEDEQDFGSVDISLDELEGGYELGDIVGARENWGGTTASATIGQKAFKMEGESGHWTYSSGDPSAGSSRSSTSSGSSGGGGGGVSYVAGENIVISGATISAPGVATEAGVAATYATKGELASYRNSTDAAIQSLENIADAAIETWTGEGEPTATNEPASSWASEELRSLHLGDVYYDVETGYSYRWGYMSGAWAWNLMKDSDITAALAKIAQIEQGYATSEDLEQALAGKLDADDAPTKVSQLENDSGYQTAEQVASAVASGTPDGRAPVYFAETIDGFEAPETPCVVICTQDGSVWYDDGAEEEGEGT